MDEQNVITSDEPTPKTDWKAEARKWEDRAKANRKEADELKAKAEKWDEYQREGMSEAEKAKQRAEAAEAELAQLKAEAQREADAIAAAESAGIPLEVARMLSGTSADELKEQAARLLRLMPVHPTRTDDGGGAPVAKTTNAQRFGEMLESALGI